MSLNQLLQKTPFHLGIVRHVEGDYSLGPRKSCKRSFSCISHSIFLQYPCFFEICLEAQNRIDKEYIPAYFHAHPKTEFLNNEIELDEMRYIKVNSDMSKNIKGVYAAGDVVSKKIRQISTAVGDGTIAGIMVEKYINGIKL